MVKLNVTELLAFYDDKLPDDRKLVSSITSLVGEDLAAGLLKHYFEDKNYKVEILPNYPSEFKQTEKKKSKHLDRWIKLERGNKTTFYQVEIKNWSSHSFSTSKVDTKNLIAYARKQFSLQWDYSKCTFRQESVSKVLKPMKEPAGYKAGNKVQPLACFWLPILAKEEKKLKPFFKIDCKNEQFSAVYCFSLSLYLRELTKGNKDVFIEVPNVLLRLKKLWELFVIDTI